MIKGAADEKLNNITYVNPCSNIGIMKAGFFNKEPKFLKIAEKLSFERCVLLVSSILKKANNKIAKLIMVNIKNIAFQFAMVSAYPPINGAMILIMPLTTSRDAKPLANAFPLC